MKIGMCCNLTCYAGVFVVHQTKSRVRRFEFYIIRRLLRRGL